MAFFHPMPRFPSKKLPKKASLRDYLYLVGETSNIFFPPLLWEDERILTIIFFKWVGSTTNHF